MTTNEVDIPPEYSDPLDFGQVPSVHGRFVEVMSPYFLHKSKETGFADPRALVVFRRQIVLPGSEEMVMGEFKVDLTWTGYNSLLSNICTLLKEFMHDYDRFGRFPRFLDDLIQLK